MKCRVLKSGKLKNENSFWAVLQKTDDQQNYHAFVRTVRVLSLDEELEVPSNVQWQLSGNGNIPILSAENKSAEFDGGFSRNCIFRFGLHKNRTIGIIYAFDSKYIEWCILNIQSFFIYDLEDLQKFGVFRESEDYEQYRDLSISDYYSLINEFVSIDDLSSELGILNTNYKLSDEAIELNDLKLKKFRK